MKKLSYHIVLAFIFATQTVWLLGCSHHVKSFECKVKCKDTTLECKTSVRGGELDLN